MTTEGWAMWITGLPSSGKSTIANGVAKRLKTKGVNVEILESDELRRILTPKPAYSEEERDWFYNVIVYIAKLLVKNGINVIIDATGNKRAYRDNARRQLSKFIEVYVKCPLDVCMKRDVKGLYRKVMEGSVKTLPGIQTIYEEPLKPEVIVETDKLSIDESIELVVNKLIEIGYIS